MKFFKMIFWLLLYLILPSIKSATKVILKTADGKILGDKKVVKLRLGQFVILTAVLNGGYEKGTEKWEVSDDLNFNIEPDKDNPLKAKVTYDQLADLGVAAVVTFKCDADQDEGEGESKELMAVGTVVGLAEDATAVELKFDTPSTGDTPPEGDDVPPSKEEPVKESPVEEVGVDSRTNPSAIGNTAGLKVDDASTDQPTPADLNAPPSESKPPYNYAPPTEPEQANPIKSDDAQ